LLTRHEMFAPGQGWVLIAFQNAFRHLAIGTPIEDNVSHSTISRLH
jgi:hypothetical protein